MNSKKIAKTLKVNYDTFTKEYQISLLRLEKFMSKAKDLLLSTLENDIEIKKYASTELMYMIKIIKNINHMLEKPMPISEDTGASSDSSKCSSVVDGNSMKLIPKVKPKINNTPKNNSVDVMDGPPSQYFIFPNTELKDYYENYDGECLVSYIRDAVRKTFFIIDQKVKTLVTMANFFESNPTRFSQMPSENEVFGIFMDNYVFRAVKQIGISPNARVFKIYLIDCGEILQIDFDQCELYHLTEEQRESPGQAIFCILDDNAMIKDKEDFFKNCLYSEFIFIVKRIRKDMLTVDLIPINASRHQSVTNMNETPSSDGVPDQHLQQHQHNHQMAMQISSASSSSHQQQPTQESKLNEERRILFEDYKTTENALEAVMGFNPKDEGRLCKFYDETTGGCFKGAHCKLEHLLPVDGGWSRDKAGVKLLTQRNFEVPEINTKIKIIPTHIVDVERFYARRVVDHSNSDLSELTVSMNAIEYSAMYKKFNRPPVEQELVIAKYSDGLWYRGRIHTDYGNETYKVLYLDYGNCTLVSLENLRLWSTRLDYLPFQALFFRLENVEKVDNVRATETMRKFMLNRTFEAQVINHFEEIGVLLFDTNGTDIGMKLVNMRLAKPRVIEKISETNLLLPA